MNIFSKKKFLVSVILSACNLIAPSVAFAQGVEAGTIITNIAIVSYSVENTIQVPIESSPFGNSISGSDEGVETKFVVDRKIDLLLTGNNNANVSPGDSQSEVTFTLQNQGNAIQEFSLTPDGLLTSDNFDVSNCLVEVHSVSGTLLAGEVVPTTGNIKLSPDQQAYINLKCDIPLDNMGEAISVAEFSKVELIVAAEKNQDGTTVIQSTSGNTDTNIETIFVDGSGTNDIDRDAKHSATRTFIATSSSAAPVVEINKVIVSVIDPNGGNTAIKDSEVTYKIQISTSGIGTIENLIVTDITPSEMTYKSNSIILDNGYQTDSSDSNDNTDFGVSSSNTATIDFGNVSAGSQHEIQLTYIIN